MNLDFENETAGEWEYVMLKNEKKEGDEEVEEEEDDDDEDGGGKGDEEILDMPPPWSPKLFVDKEQFKAPSESSACQKLVQKRTAGLVEIVDHQTQQ